MDNYYAKPVSSNQVNYGQNYYAPPPMFQNNSSSTQASSYYQPPQMDIDALKAQQEGNRDDSGMYLHPLPGMKIQKEPLIYHLYSNQDMSKIDLNKVATCEIVKLV